jgi:hypothetical protein
MKISVNQSIPLFGAGPRRGGERYPGVKVKAVVTTSDAWPHLGGVREYVARG